MWSLYETSVLHNREGTGLFWKPHNNRVPFIRGAEITVCRDFVKQWLLTFVVACHWSPDRDTYWRLLFAYGIRAAENEAIPLMIIL